jgi:hypothetical protein
VYWARFGIPNKRGESKEKGRSQIGNMIPNHKPLENKGQMSSNWGMLYIIGNIFLSDIRYWLLIFKTYFI